jgi:hypothetical protein
MRFWPDPLPTPPQPDLGLDFPPGSREHYRARVSHPSEYDYLAAVQFEFMYRLGLREQHSLLDVGCGSVRGGRLFIPYLLPGNYFGIETESWPIEAGIEHELGASILEVKAPSFLIDSDFTCTAFGRTFDYILAHSVLTHVPLEQVRRCLAEVRRCMTNESVFAATYTPGPNDGEKVPGFYTCRPESMRALAAEQGLRCVEYEMHPMGQNWLVLVPDGVQLKPRVQAVGLEPANSAIGGDHVKVTVIARAFGEGLDSLELYVNDSTNQYENGAWRLIGRASPGHEQAVVTFDWDTSGFAPGRHRIGVNATAGETTAWWYEHIPVFYELI